MLSEYIHDSDIGQGLINQSQIKSKFYNIQVLSPEVNINVKFIKQKTVMAEKWLI